MRAVVCDRYGPPEVLNVEDVAAPVPGDDQILVRVHAAFVTRSDRAMRGQPNAFRQSALRVLR